MTLIVIIQCRWYFPTAQIGYYVLHSKNNVFGVSCSVRHDHTQNISSLGSQYTFKINEGNSNTNHL